jgi:2-polyprenyl-3-methyl-5-hydroxy-6-metoxy-1,4-benzoquinol methylase
MKQNGFLPEAHLYERVCSDGLHIVRPINSDAARTAWDYGRVGPPSYQAYARLRAVATLQYVRGLLASRSRVLEVAAGDAALSATLAADGHSVTANDLRPDAIEAGLGRYPAGDKVRVWPGSLFELPHSEQFDMVIACEVIEHVAHPDVLLRHLAGFIRPGGSLLLTTPNGRYFRNRLPTFSEIKDMEALESKQFKPDADGHLFLLTQEEIRRLAHSAGLQAETLHLWATPFITGEAGVRHLSGVLPHQVCYVLERGAQLLPTTLRARLCNALVVLLRATNP